VDNNHSVAQERQQTSRFSIELIALGHQEQSKKLL
jgi:hypothetical protein